jgi:hypothetical protein
MTTDSFREMEDEPHDAIRRLEAEIETAAEVLERCRKFIFAGKLSVAIGAVWLLAVILGPLAGLGSLAGATAALLGGIVVFGSNTMTAQETAARIRTAEETRKRLIDGFALRSVGEAGID